VLDGVVTVLGTLVALLVVAVGIPRLVRRSRRKGYRGPFVSVGLTVLATAVMVAVLVGALEWSPDTDVGMAVGVGMLGGAGGVLVMSAAIVALLPRRPERRPGVRRTRVPYTAVAWLLGLGAVALPVVQLAMHVQLELFKLVAPLGTAAAASATMARRARAPQVARAADLAADGPTVLLLRGFTDDRRTFSVSDTRKGRRGVKRWLGIMFPDRDADFLSAERYLGPAVTELVGPLAGLGNPADYLPPEGTMRRYYAPDPDWQDEIERLVEQARAVLVVVSTATTSLAWELRHIRAVSAQTRTFLVRPPVGSVSAAARLRRRTEDRVLGSSTVAWPMLVDDLRELGYHLPPADPGPGTMLGFDDAGRAQVLISGATTAREYATALAARLAG
jgi:hypothetical protein